MDEPTGFWEQPEVVEAFAARAPDRRLLELIEEYERPEEVRILDLGCAGGRNTVLLAERGFDVYALDASGAMVEETRRRLAPLVGKEEARGRVRLGRMDDLSGFPAEWADLMIALGIYPSAQSWAEWEQAVSETARVIRRGGKLLVAHFTPQTDPTGNGVRPLPGEPHLHEGFDSGRAVLLEARTLDAMMGRYGFRPSVPSETVTVHTDTGRRVTVNALYRRG